MPFVPVPDTVMVEAVFELHGQVVENTYYFVSAVPWTEVNITSLLDELRIVITSTLLPLLSSAITLVRMVGTLLDAADALKIVMAVPAGAAGGQASAGLPNNSAYVVTFNTTGRGRSGRGRNYISGLCTVQETDANTVTSAFRTGLLAFYSELKAAASEIAATMVVVSRFSGVDADGKPIPRTVGVTKAITSFTTADLTLDSQRRRLPGRGQ
jgi:hypothetical protein